jgi:hypothetical protein
MIETTLNHIERVVLTIGHTVNAGVAYIDDRALIVMRGGLEQR